MCVPPRPPQRCYFISRLPNAQELIPAGADSVYIQRCSDKPYQPARLKRSRVRKEGPAPAQCQPRRGGCFFLLFFFPQELCSVRGAAKTPALVSVAMGRFIQQSLELLALISGQIMEKKGHVLQASGSLQAPSPEASHPVPPRTQERTSPHRQLLQAEF